MVRSFVSLFLIVGALAACDPAVPPSIAQHPDKAVVQIDEHAVYVVKQAGNQWVASGGGDMKKDDMVEYRRQRGIEVQSKCRVQRVVSAKGAPLLRAAVHQCRA